MPRRNVFSSLRRVAGVFLSRVMTRPLDEIAHPHPALDYRLLDEPALVLAGMDRALNLDVVAIGAAFARGDACVGAFDAGRLVGYLWYAYAATPHAGRVWVDIPSHTRYAYKAFLLPEYRGRGLGGEMYACAGAVCPRAGRTTGITYVLADNTASLVAAERAGWRTVGYAGYMEKAGVFVGFRSPGAERAGFRFWRTAARPARPVFRPVPG